MGYKHDRPKRAKFRDPSCVPPAVRWDNEASVLSWFSALHEEVADLRAAARDRVRPKRKGLISRARPRDVPLLTHGLQPLQVPVMA